MEEGGSETMIIARAVMKMTRVWCDTAEPKRLSLSYWTREHDISYYCTPKNTLKPRKGCGSYASLCARAGFDWKRARSLSKSTIHVRMGKRRERTLARIILEFMRRSGLTKERQPRPDVLHLGSWKVLFRAFE